MSANYLSRYTDDPTAAGADLAKDQRRAPADGSRIGSSRRTRRV